MKKQLLITCMVAFALAKPSYAQKIMTDDEAVYAVQPAPFNTKGNDFGVVFYRSGLIFSHNNDGKNLAWNKAIEKKGNSEACFVDKKGDAFTQNFKALKGDINSIYPEITTTVNKNNLYITRLKRSARGATPTWGIYMSEYKYGKWGKALPFNNNKSGYNVAFPTVSADGSTMYFAADIPGGFGGMDIYSSKKIGTNWTPPNNLGATINSVGDEIYPHTRPNGTLYYASNGDDKKDFDVYYTSATSPVSWEEPTLLPSPINSTADDFAIVFESNNNNGYFSSNRSGGKGGVDTYSFVVKEENKMPIMPTKYVSNPSENEMQQLIVEFDYDLISRTKVLNEGLKLHKIRFSPNDARILPQTALELDRVASFMRLSPSISIEIASHTSSIGDALENNQLSVKRANAIKSYLQLKNIRPERLMARGHGEKTPLNHCVDGMNCPDDLLDANDRVVFTIYSGHISPPMTAWNVNKAPVKASNPGNETFMVKTVANNENNMDIANNVTTYKVSVGPFETITNRLFYDYNLTAENVKIENTPHGHMIVLGKYTTAQEANKRKAEIEHKAGTKANIDIVMPNVAQSIVAPKDTKGYTVMVGPFKHVDTETYSRFNKIAKAHIKSTKAGTMVVMGSFATLQDAQKCKDLALPQMKSKTTITVLDDKNKEVSTQKKK
jgi:outer membrane protein OmpA-like peptidoglycan-associated protein